MGSARKRKKAAHGAARNLEDALASQSVHPPMSIIPHHKRLINTNCCLWQPRRDSNSHLAIRWMDALSVELRGH